MEEARMYEEVVVPANVLDAMVQDGSRSELSETPLDAVDGMDLAAITAPLEAAVKADPRASAALSKVSSAMTAFPKAHIAPPEGLPFFSLGFFGNRDLRVRSTPYDHAGSHPANGGFGFAETGRLSVGGRAGHVQGGAGDRARFLGWVGIAVTAESVGAVPGQIVRVSPSISWEAGWTLKVAGIPTGVFGANPWAAARGGVDLKVFGPAGKVAEHGPVQLFSDHHDGTGTTWNVKNGSTGDLNVVPVMHVWFPIPAGETRWVNIDAYVEVTTGFSGAFNVAAAVATLAATVRFIVLDPQ
jgi:hypothetical protein